MEQKVSDINNKIDDDRESRKDAWSSMLDRQRLSEDRRIIHEASTDKRLADIEKKIWIATGILVGIQFVLQLIFRLTIK